MPTLHPFADDAASLSIEGLTLENGQERIALYGTLDFTRDKVGLAHAKALKAVLDEVVGVLEGDPKLPDAQGSSDGQEPVRLTGPRQDGEAKRLLPANR